MPLNGSKISKVKEIVCWTLEIDADELKGNDSFVEAHGADSLRMIEVLAGLEREFKVKIDQAELANMTNLDAVLSIVERHLAVPAN
jgi:acyl carrier protein